MIWCFGLMIVKRTIASFLMIVFTKNMTPHTEARNGGRRNRLMMSGPSSVANGLDRQVKRSV